MNPNLYDQLSDLISSFPTLDAFSFYFLGICHEYVQESLSLESLFLQISAQFPSLSKDSIMRRIHDFKFFCESARASYQNILYYVEKKFSVPTIARIQDFEIYSILFPQLSKFQWFYLGTLIAKNPNFELQNSLSKIYPEFIFKTSHFRDELEKVNVLASLLEEENKSNKLSLKIDQTISKEEVKFSGGLSKKEMDFQKNLQKNKQDEEEEKINGINSNPLEPKLSNARNYIHDVDFQEINLDQAGSCCLLCLPQKLFEKSDCLICLDSMLIKWFKVTLTNCKHSFHSKCFQKYLQAMIDEKNFPIRCPMDGCPFDIMESDILKNLNKIYRKKFYSFTLKYFAETHNSKIFYCPTPNCEYFALLDELPGRRHFQCGKCNKRYCMRCRRDWHSGMTCGEAQEREEFSGIALENGYGQCSACQMFIEKVGGCRHMTCRCRNEFCWVCKKRMSQCYCERRGRV